MDQNLVGISHGHAVQRTLRPGYSPEFKQVAHLWAWLKRNALANLCPDSLTERNKLRIAQHLPPIIAECWKQAELW